MGLSESPVVHHPRSGIHCELGPRHQAVQTCKISRTGPSGSREPEKATRTPRREGIVLLVNRGDVLSDRRGDHIPINVEMEFTLTEGIGQNDKSSTGEVDKGSQG